jgi:superfamily II DNA or RNA helicase
MTGYFVLDVPKLACEKEHRDKQPFPHQQKSFNALSKTLTLPIYGYKGTLLVLPTGGGKTYAAVNWICRNILTKGTKVLWLAQSAYLLDQAAETFYNEIHNANGRSKINLRVISSNKEHANQGTIESTDDVLICTTQTAISAYSLEYLDSYGNAAKTPFRRFIDNCRNTQLFVVIDEAHHTPAYGCRTLMLSLREEIKNLYILGLTATPMHMDKRISGWLKNIFDKWICYEAKKEELELNKILAIPKYIEKQTGMEFEVDDGLFDRLVNKHKDLPDNIIEELAGNQGRNNFIVDDYRKNQNEYGKTLIFADRWFQCEYIVEKLKELGIKADAVYSTVSGRESTYQSGAGRRNNEHNNKVMQDFREDKYDVVVNVKMLTEGVDVPDVKTVMITRQTTSSILLTQMIGRALRGEKSGGGKNKNYANIVFFHDTWKRVLPWADVPGKADTAQPPVRRRNPMELISVQLIKLAVSDIAFSGFEDAAHLTFIPVGFLVCEYTAASNENEEMLSCEESVIVYEFCKDKYFVLLNFLEKQDLEAYSAEDIPEEKLNDYANKLAQRFFDVDQDNFNGLLLENIGNIVRHKAQNNNDPKYIDFEERDNYDLDKIAESMLETPPNDAYIILMNKFNNTGLHWEFLYKTFDTFYSAYQKAQKRVLNKIYGRDKPPKSPQEENPNDEYLTDEIRKQIFTRDHFTCLCCGKEKSRYVRLCSDHILPVSMGGKNEISNLQTLCEYCNTTKCINEIDFRTNITPLNRPKEAFILYDSVYSDNMQNAIRRIINVFYHCSAVYELRMHERSNGYFYKNWEIILYSGNNPQWLLKFKQNLLQYIRSTHPHVEDITIKG